MKVLDLDMDFFLTDACPLAPLGERPPESCARPYGDEQVIAFLEEQCGLSRAHPVPGRIFDTHDKALDFWLARESCNRRSTLCMWIRIPISPLGLRERILCSRPC